MERTRHSLFQSFQFARRGLVYIIKTQRNARIIFIAGCATVLCGWYFQITAGEMLAVIIIVTVVFVAEIFNSMAEGILDIVSPRHDPAAQRIKDMAAGAVLVASVVSLIIGGLIFLTYIF